MIKRMSSTWLCMLVLPLVLAALGSSACLRGTPSERPPVHLNPNMDDQPKAEPQSLSSLFSDSAAMRTPVPGTVARGQLSEDMAYYNGKDDNGAFLRTSPVPLSMKLLEAGRGRYDIYCAPCHSRVGDGQGIVARYGYPAPASHHDQRIRDAEDGYLFDVITNGYKEMPAYRNQVPVADRWAIVAYMRALQRSQNATVIDVPEPLRSQLKQN